MKPIIILIYKYDHKFNILLVLITLAVKYTEKQTFYKRKKKKIWSFNYVQKLFIITNQYYTNPLHIK